MAYTDFTPADATGGMPISLPAATAGAEELQHYDAVDCCVDISAGSGTFCLAQYGAGDVWRQYGPSWTADTTVAGGQVSRIRIPREPKFSYTIVRLAGTPDVGAAYMVPVKHGG